MKVYPKIPRYDHPVVPAELFDAEDLTLIEKFDGSAFRFTLYDQRYAEWYPDQVANAADGRRVSSLEPARPSEVITATR